MLSILIDRCEYDRMGRMPGDSQLGPVTGRSTRRTRDRDGVELDRWNNTRASEVSLGAGDVKIGIASSLWSCHMLGPKLVGTLSRDRIASLISLLYIVPHACFRYFDTGLSSTYMWDLDDGISFAGVVLFKKGERCLAAL